MIKPITQFLFTTFVCLNVCNVAFARQSDNQFTIANQAFQSGLYLEARNLFEPLLATTDENHSTNIKIYFETYLNLGEYENGLIRIEELLKNSPEDPSLLYIKGRFLVTIGKLSEAEQVFISAQKIDDGYLPNLLEIANLLEMTGRKNQAYGYYRAIALEHRRGRLNDAQSIAIAGRAFAKLEDFHEANQVYKLAHQVDPKYIQNLAWWADLFASKYNTADAKRTYEEAISLNPHNADLYVGFARSSQGLTMQGELANKALKENPNHIDALNLLAELQILDGDYDQAEKTLAEALKINPVYEPSLAYLATIFHLQGDKAGYAKIENQILEINRYCSNFYTILAENCVRRFRYKDVVEFCFKAISKDQRNWQAYALIGANLLRIGEIDNARNYLETGFKGDPFNVFARNTLELLDEYANFENFESEHFSLMIHKSESDILGQPILVFAEECFDSLAKRYPYRAEKKIRIEAYNDHDDFAVRISGLPGISLLGVCFGDVLALDTPRAQKNSKYNWARTLWHELAHVMALGLSNNRVPRWFTEGLSVYEEMRARRYWHRKMDMEFYSARDQGLLLPLRDINEGFTRPKYPEQIMLTYYQSGKFIQYLTKRYGFKAIVEILKGFGSGYDLEKSFQTVLNLNIDEVEKLLWQDIEAERKLFGPVFTNIPPVISSVEKEKSHFENLFMESKNPFFEILVKANELVKEKNYQLAEKQFLKALEIYPYYTQSGNPYLGLADIYREESDSSKLQTILEKYLEVSEFGAKEARELGNIYEYLGKKESAKSYYLRSMQVEPYHLNTHIRLADLFKESQNFSIEAQERQAILALDPLDRSNAYYQFALSYYNLGNKLEAKRQVLKSLELAPGYRYAQKLLLKCVENLNESIQ